MRNLARFGLVIGGLALGGAALPGFGSMIFTRSDPAAIIMVEESYQMENGQLRFQRVDLATMRVASGAFEIDKRPLNGRLTTQIAELRVTNWGPYNNHSRFSAKKRPAGDYALVSYSGYDWLLGTVQGCAVNGAPVYRFKAGQANLITGDLLPKNEADATPFRRPNQPTRYAAGGSTDSVGDAQRVLDERKGIQTDVVRAEYMGRVEFSGSPGGRVTYCGSGKYIRMVPGTEP